MRQLASIKKIAELHPIEGKDRIELAMVDGWSVIVKKDEFEVGGLCVYIEIDSVLPDKPEFEFLRSKNFRIKTMKMAGVISQGICFPLSILPDGNYKDGDDVTDIIGIVKNDPEGLEERRVAANNLSKSRFKWPKFLMRWKWFRKLVLPKKEARGFPDFISKTDETRIQNMPWVLHNKRPWVVTEKIDGQSGTFALVRRRSKIPFFRDKFEYIVCSRNCRLYRPDNSSYWRVSKKYGIEQLLRNAITPDLDWIAIQGEIIGPGIQGNKYKEKDVRLFVFNVIDSACGRWSSMAAKSYVEHDGVLEFVPILDKYFVLPDTVNEMLEYAHGGSALGGTIREGIVIRSQDGTQSFKAVDPLFLLKYGL